MAVISSTAEYALRAIVTLAREPGRAWTSAELSTLTRVPRNYLSKVMRRLVRHGLVASRRGQGGGFRLAVPAGRMTVLQVIDAVDPLTRIDRCPLGDPDHDLEFCPLHRRLAEAVDTVERAFASTSIDELLESEVGSAPLCTVTVRKT